MARARHALALAAGELRRLAALQIAKRYEFDHATHPLRDFDGRAFLHFQTEGDVLLDREVGKERVALEDLVNVSMIGRDMRHVFAVEPDGSFGGGFKSRDHPEQGGFAAAGRPQQCEEFTFSNREIHLADSGEIAEAFGDGS
jgi:hypothetical protein